MGLSGFRGAGQSSSLPSESRANGRDHRARRPTGNPTRQCSALSVGHRGRATRDERRRADRGLGGRRRPSRARRRQALSVRVGTPVLRDVTVDEAVLRRMNELTRGATLVRVLRERPFDLGLRRRVRLSPSAAAHPRVRRGSEPGEPTPGRARERVKAARAVPEGLLCRAQELSIWFQSPGRPHPVPEPQELAPSTLSVHSTP